MTLRESLREASAVLLPSPALPVRETTTFELQAHRDDVPRIDPDFMWRVPALGAVTGDATGVTPVTGQLEEVT